MGWHCTSPVSFLARISIHRLFQTTRDSILYKYKSTSSSTPHDSILNLTRRERRILLFSSSDWYFVSHWSRKNWRQSAIPPFYLECKQLHRDCGKTPSVDVFSILCLFPTIEGLLTYRLHCDEIQYYFSKWRLVFLNWPTFFYKVVCESKIKILIETASLSHVMLKFNSI